MNEKTLTALNGSIEKWERIVDGTGIDNGPDNCPLCEKFHDLQCDGCPVAERVGTIFCNQTPYKKWVEHRFDVHGSARDPIQPGCTTWRCTTCLRLAKAELKFLKSLLPK